MAGAADHIIKPFDAMDLKVRLRNTMTILALRSENAELRHSLNNRFAQETGGIAEKNQLAGVRHDCAR